MKQGAYQFWLAGSIALSYLATASLTRAQIIPDATLPANSRVTSQGNNTSRIDGGTQSGSNLFHSFRDFSVGTSSTAYFNNASDVRNIISRVTGGSISNIDGLIRANGSANLFLLNPNGIIFGPNASLNVGGSFVASTANSLIFQDGTSFSATNPEAIPLLTVSVPIGLQFGASAGRIINQSQASPEGFTNSIGAPLGLGVLPGQTLALVGGDVILKNGNLAAFEGRIELGSVAGPGIVSLTPTENGWALGYEGIQSFGTIELSQESVVDASGFPPSPMTEEGGRGGEIQVRGNRLTLDSSGITTSNFSSAPGGNLTVRASDVELSGMLAGGNLPAGLFSQTQGSGAAGNLTIETARLTVGNGAQISSGTSRSGQGGTLTVRASESVTLIGRSPDGQLGSGLFSQTQGSGNAGDLKIFTGRLIVRDGAEVSAVTRMGAGNAGDLFVEASESVEAIGGGQDPTGRFISSGIAAQADPGTTGAGGNLTIQTKELRILDGAVISARTGGQGRGGDVTIGTERLIARDGGQVLAGAASTGQGGTLTVNASESVELIGTRPDGFPSGLFTQSQNVFTEFNAGDAGNLTIATKRLILRDGAAISADTFADGQGGSLTINASESIELIGRSVQQLPSTFSPFIDSEGRLPSRVTAETRGGSGNAGDLTMTAPQLIIKDGAIAAVSSKFSTGAAAGNLLVNVPVIRLENGSIAAETRAGNFGNITLNTQDLQMRRESNITTSAESATGGNILINTDTLAALENSDIKADAAEGPGGRVTINARGIFGTEFREQGSLSTSDITATSNLGPEFNGIVEINTPETDPTQGLATLPQENEPPPIPQNPCAVVGQGSEFVNTGHGGLPPNPREALNLGVVSSNNEGRQLSRSNPIQIVEAQGWIRDANGKIHLVARSPTVTPYSSWLSPACAVSPKDPASK